ncbi:MAG: hypothetical protein FJ387_28755, partial [Verrucomicrobia bacterium]|nr:hypothetical protein [Verrucomicrobiota bacterium]
MMKSWMLGGLVGEVLVASFLAALAQPTTGANPSGSDQGLALVLHSPLFLEPLQPVAPTSAQARDTQELARLLEDAYTLWERALPLARNKPETAREILGTLIRGLESFAAEHPISPWKPAVHALLGKHYSDMGRFTLALQRFDLAWQTTRSAPEGPAKEVADYSVAHLCRLLASFCRIEVLTPLLQELQGRVFERAHIAQMMRRSREAYWKTVRNPRSAYQCGVVALERVAREWAQTNQRDCQRLPLPPPAYGASLAMLADVARQAQLDLVAVQRVAGDAIPVPSVVHWSQNHFSAVVGREGDLLRLEDPTLGGGINVTVQTLLAESTGYFLAPSRVVGPDFRRLPDAEAVAIWGRGYPYNLNDPDDQPLSCVPGTDGFGSSTTSSQPGATATSGRGGSQAERAVGGGATGRTTCFRAPCYGMLTWRVSEPYINLWIEDTPLGYVPSQGPAVEFRIALKERDDAGSDPDFFSSVGSLWRAAWLSWVSAQELFQYGMGNVHVFLPGGGVSKFYFSSAQQETTGSDYFNRARLHKLLDGGGNLLGLELLQTDGSTDVYTHYCPSTYSSLFFLKHRRDPQGRQLTFNYNACPSGFILLTSVTDADNRTTSLYYDNQSWPNRITRVVDPFQHTAYLGYDNYGQLNQIADVEGIASSVAFNVAWTPISLTTPYGTTAFESHDGGDLQGSNVDRWIVITHPGSPENARYDVFPRPARRRVRGVAGSGRTRCSSPRSSNSHCT